MLYEELNLDEIPGARVSHLGEIMRDNTVSWYEYDSLTEIARLKAQLDEANRRAAYTSPQDDWDRVQRLAQDAADQGLDPWQIMIAIRVPRRPPKEDPWYWININDRSVQIPANDNVQEMRLPFAETLLGMLRAENRAQDFADSIEVYDPVTNPKS